jgi:hypothetical protein
VQLLKAETSQVPEIVQEMRNYRRWTDPELNKSVAQASANSRMKLSASLALLPEDAAQVPFLETRLLTATPGELPVLRKALEPHRSELTPKLWSVVDAGKRGEARLLPATSALAV